MDFLRKSISAFCAFAFVGSGVLALFLFNFDQRAFTAETYKQALAREDFYNRIPALMADAVFLSMPDQSQLPVAMGDMGRSAWEQFFRSLLPAEVLRAMGDDAINSAIAYLNMETDAAYLNLAPLKASLPGEAGVQAVYSLLGAFPQCDLFQLGQITLNLMSGGELVPCNPPADLHPLLTPVIQGQLQLTAAAIPDQVVIISAPPQNDPRQRLETARLYMRVSPLLPISLLLGILIFGVRSTRGLLKWWGIPLALTGGIAFILALLGGPVFGEIIQRLLIAQMPTYLPALFWDYAGDLAAIMVGTLLAPVMWQGLALGVFGAGMVGAKYLIRK